MKFKLQCDFPSIEGPTINTLEFNAVSLDEVLPQLEIFLLGTGYKFKGHLDIVED